MAASVAPTAPLSIDVFQVSKDEIMQFAGKPWQEIVAQRPESVRQAVYRAYVALREGQEPPVVDRAFLPYGFAWLRNIGGVAFLYYQNW